MFRTRHASRRSYRFMYKKKVEESKMNKTKLGLLLVVLGNMLYISYIFFGDSNSSFGDFTSGLLLGLSIGTNLLGIILIAMNMGKNKK